jgi:hypothetical protein
MKRLTFLCCLSLLVTSSTAWAEDADLKQTIADLTSQTNDKQRLDTHDAAKVELSQIRSWLSEAANAVQEEKEARCRQLFELARAQLLLVDQLVLLDQISVEVKKIEKGLAAVKQVLSNAKKRLEEQQAQIRAQKATNK